jgi:hypothetical protein
VEILRGRIRELVWAWDPIGIGDERVWAESEYDELISTLSVKVSMGASRTVLSECVNTWLLDAGLSSQGLDQFLDTIEEARNE